ncbi:MAG: SHOCT domain-containing protein [Bacteroidales bacterium]|jgi:hypothetical protein|nr:SHOCT domain-containing protein [Bacteroidales bacterium]
MKKKLLVELAIGLFLVGLTGCAVLPPIQPATSSKSHFESAVYSGELIKHAEAPPDVEQFRVFTQGATGFVPQSAVRSNAFGQATTFCDQRDKKMKIIEERRSTGAQILGNFPRSELVFVCLEKPITTSAEDVVYMKLSNLKKLLNSGVLTPTEFDREKAKILSAP